MSDQGATGAGGAQTAQATLTITVGSVNDPLRITLPLSFAANEGTAGLLAGISVSDAELFGLRSNVTAVLTVAQGALSVPLSQIGIGFANNSDAAGQVLRFTGPLLNVATALASAITYTPPGNSNGRVAFSLALSYPHSDALGSSGAVLSAASSVIAVAAVNDAPSWSVASRTVFALEFSQTNFTGISVTDPDAGEDRLSALSCNVSCAHCSLRLNSTAGLVMHATHSPSRVAFSGALEHIQAALARLFYLGDRGFSGNDTVAVSVRDNGFTGSGGSLSAQTTMTVVVAAVPGASIFTAPFDATTLEDTPVNLAAVTGQPSIVIFKQSGPKLQVTVSASHGVLTLSPAALPLLSFAVGDGAADRVVSFNASGTNATAAFAQLTYLPDANFNGHDRVVFSVYGLQTQGVVQTLSCLVIVTAVNDHAVFAADTTNVTVFESDVSPFSSFCCCCVEALCR